LITHESLIKAGWKKMGNAWYHQGGKKTLSNWEGKWQLWENGIYKEVKIMEEI
jgi:hypothetical protein